MATPSVLPRGCFATFCGPAQAQFALKKVDRLAHAAIVAEAVFVERGIDLLGQPQWIAPPHIRRWCQGADVVVAILKSLS